MALQEDFSLRFRDDACFTIYSLIADALYRCSTQSVASRIIVKICSLPPTIMPSLSPMYLFSVANSGPGIENSKLRNFFPRFRKSYVPTSTTQLGLRWGGVVRVLTTDVGEKGFHQYELVMRCDNGFETVQLPRAENETELESGTVCEIIVTGGVQELVQFSRSICEKTSMLKLKNLTLDYFLQGIYTDDAGHHIKGLRICDGTISLGDFTAEELLCVGAVEHLSRYKCGFREGSAADLRFRELVLVGTGHAGSTKWSLDSGVALISMAMANEIIPSSDPQTSVVVYFEDGCYTPASESVLKGLTKVKWNKFGLKIMDMQMADSGEVMIRFKEPRRISSMFMVLHIHHNLKTMQRSPSPARERIVKASAEACMMDLKARFPELFLSEKAIELQYIATKVSECISNIIITSTNEDFQGECASILKLPLQNLGDCEGLICAKMFEVIQQQDGQKRPKSRVNVTEAFANKFAPSEDVNDCNSDIEEPLDNDGDDIEPLYYVNEDEEALNYDSEYEETLHYEKEGEECL